MNSEHPVPQTDDFNLPSQAATARRDAMRGQLQAEFERFHAGRRRTRTAVAWSAATVVLIAATTWLAWPLGKPVNSPHNVAVQVQSPDEVLRQPVDSIYKSAHARIEFELIDDDQMLELLSEAGQPSALAWFDGKPVVIPLSTKSAL